MSEDLIVGLLRDVHTTQLKQAETLGFIAADLKTLTDGHKTIALKVEKLEQKDWKQIGFLAGIVAIGEPTLHYFAKKLGF